MKALKIETVEEEEESFVGCVGCVGCWLLVVGGSLIINPVGSRCVSSMKLEKALIVNFNL